jgi:hypothetical protein
MEKGVDREIYFLCFHLKDLKVYTISENDV